jgi:beta-1,4-N-acetylglucosaminyltransferase
MAEARKLLIVCSPGGHLLQMRALRPAWEGPERTWVTLRGADVDVLLRDEDVVLAHGPTNRSLRKLALNVLLAWRTIRAQRPDAILSTGAALAVPFFVVGRLHRCRLVYVESLTRTATLSLSGRLVYPLAHAFFVQWPDATRLKRARYVGGLL